MMARGNDKYSRVSLIHAGTANASAIVAETLSVFTHACGDGQIQLSGNSG